MRFVWPLLLLSALLGAQDFQIDLSGDWRFEPGQDRPEFARGDFDDSGWGHYTLPRPAGRPGVGLGVPPGTYWLRKTVTLPADLRPGELALTLGEVHDAYQVFVNGELAGSTVEGSDVWSVQTARPRTFRFAHRGGDRLCIALRASRPGRVSAGGVHFGPTQHADPGPYLLTSAAGAPVGLEAAGHRRRLFGATPLLVESVAGALLAFFVWLLYLNAPESGELRRLALLLAATSSLRMYQYVVLLLDLPLAAIAGGPAFSAAISLALAWFLLSVAEIRHRWVSGLFLIVGGVAVLSRMAQLVLPESLLWDENSAVALVSLGSGLVVVAGLQRAVASGGWGGARTWLNGIGLLLVLVDYQRTPSLRVFPPYWSGFGFVGDVFDISLLGLSLAATWVIIRRLGADRREKERLASELEAARIVQQLMLPRVLLPGVDAVYLPANEVGGDFWHCDVCADGTLLLLAGDVSGKGLKAAMIVSLVTGVLQNRHSDEPGRVLQELNRALLTKLDGGFVTATAARIDERGHMRWASAGNPAPYGDGVELAGEAGLPLGLVADVEYTEATADGGRYVFVSDGVVEAANAKGELFGFARTREMSARTAAEIAEAARAWGQTDDITVVTVQGTAVRRTA